MRRLTLEGIDFSNHIRLFRGPIIQTLQWVVDHIGSVDKLIIRRPNFADWSPGLFSDPSKVEMYLRSILDYLSKYENPLTPRQMIDLIRVDQATRLAIGWPCLEKIGPKTRTPTAMVACRNLLSRVFSYDTFTAGRQLRWDSNATMLEEVICPVNVVWCAHSFLRQVFRLNNLSYCPYCNAEVVYSVDAIEDDKRLRTDIDHFFPRFKYPYLALSPYNLVPACSRCNERLKRDIDVISIPKRKGAHRKLGDIEKNLELLEAEEQSITWPYADDFHEGVRFSYKTINLELLAGEIADDKIRLDAEYRSGHDSAKYANSVRQFKLRTVYERIYQRELKEMPLRLRIAKSCYADVLGEAFHRWGLSEGIGLSTAVISRFLSRDIVTRSRINDERLGKLRADIAYQLGITSSR